MKTPKNIGFIGLLALFCICLSCVDDIDLDQADEIVFNQQVDLDLVYFTLEIGSFDDAPIQPQTLSARDTTRLEFLEENFVQENLVQIDLLFKIENTFPAAIETRATFQNDADEVMYELIFEVPPSQDGIPEVEIVTQSIFDEDLEGIRNSIKLVVEMTLQTEDEALEGSVNFQSKALYSLEFTDL